MPLAGGLTDAASVNVTADSCAIFPDDYPGFIPKLEKKQDETVLKGEPILYDRDNPEVKICSPVTGVIKNICRGEKRKLLYVEISTVKDVEKEIRPEAPMIKTREDALAMLCSKGFLSQLRQRPYDIVPRLDTLPRDIFVTCIDSAPLAAGYEIWPGVNCDNLKKGIEVLSLVTDGKIYLSMKDDYIIDNTLVENVVSGFEDYAETVVFAGPHPVGNAGIQASHISPVNKGETIWTLDLTTLCRIGRYAREGVYDTTVSVAVTGIGVKRPCIVNTVEGAPIADIVKENIKDTDFKLRIISGNVLTGIPVDVSGFLHFPWHQVTVIADGGDVHEFLGWASLSPRKLTAGRTFLSRLFGRKFAPDARINGGERAMILSGIYERMIPMDILPEFLIKAIIGRDIETMEKLGIYEVAPEDFALAEFADPSKLPLQQIVREGLEYLRKENQ